MKLVVGLGNPERKYTGTRHNVGFAVVAEIARRHATGSPKEKFHGEVVEAVLGAERALLLSPLTYMNLSGTAVLAARDFYKIDNHDLLIICDDLNLPLGKLRLRPQGSAGGQKGLADIIRRLGTEELPRLRIGIGAAPDERGATAWVLAKFAAEEQTIVDEAVRRAAAAAVAWADEGITAAMNAFN